MSTEERRHHSYSPSTLQMREACPLWCPTGEAGEKAERGTLQHRYTETGHDDGSLTDEEMAAAQECLDYSHQIKEENQAELNRRGLSKLTISEVVEPYLPVDHRKWRVPVFNPTTFKTEYVTETSTTAGYADRLLLIPGLEHIELFDWKFGRWPVTDAEDNLQGISYVLGAFLAYPWAQTVRLHFKQPHIESVSSHTFNRDNIEDKRLRVMVTVEQAVACAGEEDYSKANMTVPGCNFCGRIGKCQKVRELALKVGDKFWPVEMPENLDPISMDRPENVAAGLRVAQIVEAWASGFRRQKTLQVLEGAAPVPEGYQIMKKEQRREIKSRFRLFRAFRKYLTRKEIESSLGRPSLTTLEKLFQDKFPRGRKTAELAEFKDRLLQCGAVEKGQPVPYLGAVPKKSKETKQPESQT